MPFGRIGELCRRKKLCFIGDGAQVCGVVPVDMERDGINILCMPGHKGLYGISGTGLLITDGNSLCTTLSREEQAQPHLKRSRHLFSPRGLKAARSIQ